MRNRDPRILLRILACTLGTLVSSSVAVFAEDVSARVLAGYPTREQLQQRIDDAKRTDAAAFAEANNDFGEAIRVSRTPNGPPWPGKRSRGIPLIKPSPVLSELKTKAMWARSFTKADKIEPGSEWVEFYRNHLDALTIDDRSPLLKEVLIDVVLNGWHDWTHWDHEKLIPLREKFPELHRVYALRELQRLKAREMGGVLLALIARPDIAPELFSPVREGVKDLVTPEDSFEFVLDVYIQTNDPIIRTRMEHFVPAFSVRAGKRDRVREIWRPFLESDMPLLRFEARRAFDLPIPDPFACDDLHKRWIADNDPDPGRREKARQTVKNRELLDGIYRRQEKQNR